MKISNQFFHQQWNCFQEYHVLTLALHTTYFPVLLPTDPSIKSYSSGTNKRYGPYPVGWHTVWTLKNWKLLTSDSDEFIVMKESERISIISLWGTNGKYLISDGTIKMMLLTKGLWPIKRQHLKTRLNFLRLLWKLLWHTRGQSLVL